MLRLSKVIAASLTLLFALVLLGNPLFAHPVPLMVKADVELIANNGSFEFNEESGQGFYLNNSPIFDLSEGDFTIHVWVKLEAYCNPDDQCRMPIVDKTEGWTADGWGLFKWDSDNRFRFCLGGWNDEGCTFVDGLYQTVVQSQTVPVEGVWYSVAAVKTSRRISIYVNGKLEGSNRLGDFRDTNSAPLRVGVGTWEGWRWYGEIAQVQLFRSALSGLIILELFERSKVRYGY